MSRLFWAENRETGEGWKKDSRYKEFLMMYDSGYLAVVTDYGYAPSIVPLDSKVWKVVWRV